MPELSLRDRILALMKRADYRPMDKVEMSKAIGLHSSERRTLSDVLRELEMSGAIALIRKDRYVLPKTADLVTGTIFFHHNGNAHVIDERTGEPEIVVFSENTGTAMHGDRVVVRKDQPRRGAREAGRVEGKVIRILATKNINVVGTLQRTKTFHYVVPDDPRMQHDIAVPPPRMAAEIGDKVVVKLEPWLSRNANPEGEIAEVLGSGDSAEVAMISIIRKYDLPTAFPDAVLRDAERIPVEIAPEEIARREDLRGQFIITIDPDDAKDFDDAINVERTRDGWRLGVHIADVSHYVRPGTALDREARARGNSTYLADRVIPMLPEKLSNGLCSLRANEEKLTFSTFIDFTADGKVKSARFAKTVIRSAARLTYRQAFAILENQPVPPTPNYERGGKVELSAKPVPLNVTPQLVERVKTAWALASLLRKNRFAAGSLDLDFPEVKIWLDDKGRAERLEKVENDISHQLVEECMLVANEAVAKGIKYRKVPAIYRVHEDPDPDRLNEYRETAAIHGFRVGNLQSRPELQKLLAAIRGTPEEYALKIGLLKSLKRAVYDVKPIGHYGLSKVNYTHFTSPIRRYADLLVHRILNGEAAGDMAAMAQAAEHISKTERVSADAEKDSTTLKKMEFFQRQLDSRKPEVFQAIVTDVRSFGLTVDLPEVMQTGVIKVSELGEDFFQFDAARMTFTGRKSRKRYKLGDQLSVLVSRVDAYRRQVDFALAE
jgi:ribonuclease R